MIISSHLNIIFLLVVIVSLVHLSWRCLALASYRIHLDIWWLYAITFARSSWTVVEGACVALVSVASILLTHVGFCLHVIQVLFVTVVWRVPLCFFLFLEIVLIIYTLSHSHVPERIVFVIILYLTTFIIVIVHTTAILIVPELFWVHQQIAIVLFLITVLILSLHWWFEWRFWRKLISCNCRLLDLNFAENIITFIGFCIEYDLVLWSCLLHANIVCIYSRLVVDYNIIRRAICILFCIWIFVWVFNMVLLSMKFILRTGDKTVTQTASRAMNMIKCIDIGTGA